MSSGEGLGRYPIGELSAAPEVLLGEHVRVQVEASESGEEWQPAGHIFEGTVVGGPFFPEGEDPGPLVNVMPDEPYPTGERFASKHPRYFLLEPFWVVRGREGDVPERKFLYRYVVTRAEVEN